MLERIGSSFWELAKHGGLTHEDIVRITGEIDRLSQPDRLIDAENIPLAEIPSGLVPLPLIELSPAKQVELEAVEEKLESHADDYRRNPTSSLTTTNVWRSFLERFALLTDVQVEVPSLELTDKALEGFFTEEYSRFLAYVPEMLVGPEGLRLLHRGFPELGDYFLHKAGTLVNTHDEGGWYAVESAANLPFTMSNGLNLSELFKGNRRGQRLSTYILASKFRKRIFGRDFDVDDRFYPQTDLCGTFGIDPLMGFYGPDVITVANGPGDDSSLTFHPAWYPFSRYDLMSIRTEERVQ